MVLGQNWSNFRFKLENPGVIKVYFRGQIAKKYLHFNTVAPPTPYYHIYVTCDQYVLSPQAPTAMFILIHHRYVQNIEASSVLCLISGFMFDVLTLTSLFLTAGKVHVWCPDKFVDINALFGEINLYNFLLQFNII